MQSLRAQVREGRLVMDEPTDLPEGEVLELVALSGCGARSALETNTTVVPASTDARALTSRDAAVTSETSTGMTGVDSGSHSRVDSGTDSGKHADSGSGSCSVVAVAGGTLVTLASNRTHPSFVAVDSASVYWTDVPNTPDGGEVM
jgi:hypothetical protein